DARRPDRGGQRPARPPAPGRGQAGPAAGDRGRLPAGHQLQGPRRPDGAAPAHASARRPGHALAPGLMSRPAPPAPKTIYAARNIGRFRQGYEDSPSSFPFAASPFPSSPFPSPDDVDDG